MHARTVRLGHLLVVAGILAPKTRAQDARALFLQHCASCHGETGDGRGTATLDRPARSFKDGGFSHGNTIEAIARTITFGIPGTPMPAGPSVLTEADRNALAEYVLTLGPPLDPVSGAESILRVADRAAIVRGKLPPIAEGLPERPRGMLIGLPDGWSFEYRIDDVRLLGLRQGAFVDRTDWRGRGGDTLKPLGTLLWVSGNGDPGPTFLRADTGAPLEAHLVSSAVEAEAARITYELRERSSAADLLARALAIVPALAIVDEAPLALHTAAGSGFTRRFSIESDTSLRLRVAGGGPALFASGMTWSVRRHADGTFEAISLGGLLPGELLTPVAGGAEVTLRPGPWHARDVDVSIVLAPSWNDELQARWLAGVAR